MRGKDFIGSYTLDGKRIISNDAKKVFSDVALFGRYKFAVVYTEVVVDQPIKEERFGVETTIGHRNVGYQQINYYESEKDALEFMELCTSIEPSEPSHCYVEPILFKKEKPKFAKDAQNDYFVIDENETAMAFNFEMFDDDGYLMGYDKTKEYHFSSFMDKVLAWFDNFDEACTYADRLNGYDGLDE